MTGERVPYAIWKATLNGADLTSKIDPLLVSISISEKRGDEADQLDMVIIDRDGMVEIPKSGARIAVAMGWRQGVGVPLGLVHKGSFKVDEASFRGPPDLITIRARSADFTDSFRVRRERSFVDKTVGQIIGEIAIGNDLGAIVEATLAEKLVPALGHGAKSDAALLAALGRRFDAAATVKEGTLIFAPIGKGKTAKGTKMPAELIVRSQTDTIDYSRVERDSYDGVEATWHDKETGTRKKATLGGSGEGKPKRIRKVFANEADARQAAEAEHSRTGRAKAKATVKLAYGRPDLIPERPIILRGWKPEIDARSWIVAECTHTMDGQGGLQTTLQLEALR